MTSVYSIFFHNYYGRLAYWLDFFSKNTTSPSTLYYNIVDESIYNQKILQTDLNTVSNGEANKNAALNNIIYRHSSNKGKDIGGKMVLIDSYLKLKSPTPYGLFLHDKKSLYKANNIIWANNLLKIAEANFSKRVFKIFNDDPQIGIIAGNGSLKNDYDFNDQSFTGTNKVLLPQLQEKFNIYPSSYNYIAGTMFWFRMKPVEDFFLLNDPLLIRAMLEDGNVSDEISESNTHCWERLLSWIITSQGYKINTI